MATPEENLEKLLADFEKANPKGGKNLREILKDTPELKDRFLDAVKAGNLDKIEGLDSFTRGRGVLGTYNPSTKTIALPMDYLDIADKNVAAGNMIRTTAGHELGHAINRDDIIASNKKFREDVEKIAKGPSPHDYTEVLKTFNKASRDREAGDEIAGINILAAHVKRNNPKATLEDLYKASPGDMQNYVDVSGTAPNQKYTPKAGLTFDKDLKIESTKENIDAVGKHFYDGNGYPKNYGERSMRQIAQIEADVQAAARAADPKFTPPEIKVNLEDLGIPGARMPPGFTDSSPTRGPRSPIAPTDTGTSHRHDHDHASTERINGNGAPALFTQSMAALEKMGSASGITDREQMTAVAAAMAVQAQKDGLRQIDSVVASTDGKGLIAMQGNGDNATRSYIDRNQAAQQSPEENMIRLERNTPQPDQPTQQQGGPAR